MPPAPPRGPLQAHPPGRPFHGGFPRRPLLPLWPPRRRPAGRPPQPQPAPPPPPTRPPPPDLCRPRLYEAELRKREAEAQAQEAAKSDIGWGHQIRSYVLHPYQMVKDLRTGVERGDAQRVLDGDLDRFMEASLAARLGGDDPNIKGDGE